MNENFSYLDTFNFHDEAKSDRIYLKAGEQTYAIGPSLYNHSKLLTMLLADNPGVYTFNTQYATELHEFYTNTRRFIMSCDTVEKINNAYHVFDYYHLDVEAIKWLDFRVYVMLMSEVYDINEICHVAKKNVGATPLFLDDPLLSNSNTDIISMFGLFNVEYCIANKFYKNLNLFKNQNLSDDFYEKLYEIFNHSWDSCAIDIGEIWHALLENKSVSFSWIIKHIPRRLYYAVTARHDMKPEYLPMLGMGLGDIVNMSQTYVDLEIIERYLRSVVVNGDYDNHTYNFICHNPNITCEFLEKYRLTPSQIYLIRNPSKHLEPYFDNYIDQLDTYNLSAHAAISLDFIIRHIKKLQFTALFINTRISSQTKLALIQYLKTTLIYEPNPLRLGVFTPEEIFKLNQSYIASRYLSNHYFEQYIYISHLLDKRKIIVSPGWMRFIYDT